MTARLASPFARPPYTAVGTYRSLGGCHARVSVQLVEDTEATINLLEASGMHDAAAWICRYTRGQLSDGHATASAESAREVGEVFLTMTMLTRRLFHRVLFSRHRRRKSLCPLPYTPLMRWNVIVSLSKSRACHVWCTWTLDPSENMQHQK